MHGEDLLIDDGRNRQTVEAVGERLPQLDIVPPLALVVEAVDAIDRRALVVTTENKEIFGVLDLVGQEEADCFERLLAAVNVVTEEEIVGLGGKAAVFEEAQKVVVLPVDVTAYLFTYQPWPPAQEPGLVTLMGASNSNRIGWEMKISLALVQR